MLVLKAMLAAARPGGRVKWVAVIVALSVLIGGALWYRHHHRYKHFAVHEPGKVYRSAWVEADVFTEVIAKYKIRTVINLCNPGEMGDRIVYQRKAIREAGAELLEMPFPPNNTWSVDFPVVDQIEAVLAGPDSYPVWIHCQHGRERTVKALAIYDISQQGLTARESLEKMPLYGMPHPWHTIVFAHNYESRIKSERTASDRDGDRPLR